MARLMGIVTHHKGGTVWIKRVIRALSAEIGVPWTGIWSDKRKDHIPAEGRAFLCNWSGWLPQSLWQSGEFAALHVVRDPHSCRWTQRRVEAILQQSCCGQILQKEGRIS